MFVQIFENTSFTKLKGIFLVFGVCFSLKVSSRLCVDDFVKQARGLHKLYQARRVFLDFFGLCVKAIIIIILVCGTILFIFLLLWIYDIEMGGLCELRKVFYVRGKRFTKAPCLYFKKNSLVCVSFGNLYFHFILFLSPCGWVALHFGDLSIKRVGRTNNPCLGGPKATPNKG